MTIALRLREASERCPKRMVHGPCGGVRGDDGCEVPGIRCSFAAEPHLLSSLAFSPAEIDPPENARDSGDALPVAPRRPAAEAFAARVAEGAVITADLPVLAADAGIVAEAGARLRDLTAVVPGEPPGLRDALSPTHRALLLVSAGATVIAGITCRDRNRVAIEGELAALADLGAAGVLAVTGDHPSSTALREAQPVFDLDSTRLTALVRRAGLFAAVVEHPAAPPVSFRPARLALKAQAGAELGILNLCRDIATLARFTTALDAAGTAIAVVVSVPIVSSRAAAKRLSALPGVALPPELISAIATGDDDVQAGIRAASAWATRALEVPGVVGVHLTAVRDDTDATGLAAVDAVAQTAARIRESRRTGSARSGAGA